VRPTTASTLSGTPISNSAGILPGQVSLDLVDTRALTGPVVQPIDAFVGRSSLDAIQRKLSQPAPTSLTDVHNAYFKRLDSDAAFRNAVDDYYGRTNAQYFVDKGTPAQAFAGQLSLSVLDASTGVYPGVGEIQDTQVLFGKDSSLGHRVVAAGSLAISVLTGGASPNAGPALRTARFETRTAQELAQFQQLSRQIDVLPNNHYFSQIDTYSVPSGPLGGPYSYLVDPPNVGPYQPFTAAQRKRLFAESKMINQGVLRSDQSGVKAVVVGSRPQRGVTRPANEAQVDHIVPLSKGGTNSFSNAQILTREENLRKGSRR
jgi:hypothetical protein